MTKSVLRFAAASLLLFGLAACGGGNDAGSADGVATNASPEQAVMSSVELLQNNDIDGLLQATLPPAEYQEMRESWGERSDEPVSAEDRRKFAKNMQRLTAPGAEEALFAQLQPVLANFDKTYGAQMPMYVGMGQTMAATAINKSEEMTPEQKQQAMDAVAALANWIQTTDWSDPAKAKQAIAVVTDTARQLDLMTIDEVRALSYEQAMPKASRAMAGVKQVLAVYGLDVNAALESVSTETLSSDADSAVVKYTYSVLGQPLSGTTKLVKRDGHWYSKDMLEKIEKEVASASSAASTAPVEAASVY